MEDNILFVRQETSLGIDMLLRGAWSCCNYHVLMTFTKSTRAHPLLMRKMRKDQKTRILKMITSVMMVNGHDNDDYAVFLLLIAVKIPLGWDLHCKLQ